MAFLATLFIQLQPQLTGLVTIMGGWAIGQIANYYRHKAAAEKAANVTSSTANVLAILAKAGQDAVTKYLATNPDPTNPPAEVAKSIASLAVAEAKAHGSDILAAAGWGDSDILKSLEATIATQLATPTVVTNLAIPLGAS